MLYKPLGGFLLLRRRMRTMAMTVATTIRTMIITIAMIAIELPDAAESQKKEHNQFLFNIAHVNSAWPSFHGKRNEYQRKLEHKHAHGVRHAP